MKFLQTRGFTDPFRLGLFDDELDSMFRPLFKAGRYNNFLKTDIQEKNGKYLLDMDIPGFEKKDIEINLEDGYLTISAKKTENIEEKDAKLSYIRRERTFGSCSRTFYVGDIKEADITASYDKGILSITFPKEKEAVKSKKQIEIK